jgi:hypothetical protein
MLSLGLLVSSFYFQGSSTVRQGIIRTSVIGFYVILSINQNFWVLAEKYFLSLSGRRYHMLKLNRFAFFTHYVFLLLFCRSHIYHEMEEPQENSMLASIRPNLHLRRKSMPAITGLDTFALSRIAESAAAASEAAISSTQAVLNIETKGWM